jgi:hypothetical protein
MVRTDAGPMLLDVKSRSLHVIEMMLWRCCAAVQD